MKRSREIIQFNCSLAAKYRFLCQLASKRQEEKIKYVKYAVLCRKEGEMRKENQ
jgi:ribosomal protein L33